MTAQRKERMEWLCLGLLITAGFYAVPVVVAGQSQELVSGLTEWIGFTDYYYVWQLAYALVLVASSPGRYGVCIGEIRRYPWRTLVVCVAPVAVVAVVYPLLPVRPFSGAPVGVWLISPAAQDLVFAGYLYTKLDGVFPNFIHRKVPIRQAVFLAALYFAGLHLWNLTAIGPQYVLFQVGYTFAGAVFLALTRQWTNSILYLVLTHMAVNIIASL